jgi:hypothetical protein
MTSYIRDIAAMISVTVFIASVAVISEAMRFVM